MKHLWLLFLALMCAASAHTQELLSHRYSTKDGLASNTVYNVLSDKRGFLWFATDAGVSQFDGTTFRNFTVKDGLEDNEVLALFEDSDGRIWFYCYNKLPCFYYKGRIYNSRNFAELTKLYNYNWLLLCRRSNETWFAGPKNIYRFRNNKIDLFPLPDSKGLLLLTEVDSVLYALTTTAFYAFNEHTQQFEQDRQLPSTDAFFTRIHDLGNGHYLFVAPHDDKSTDFYKCRIDIEHHRLDIKKWGHFTKEITNCITDVKAHIALVAFADNTVVREELDSDTMLTIPAYNLRSVVSGTTVDIQGNRWITLLDGGVEMFPASPSAIVTIPQSGSTATACYSLFNLRGNIIAGTNDNSLLFIKSGVLTSIKHMSQYSRRDRVLDIKADRQGTLWIGGDKGICTYKVGSPDFSYIPMWVNIKDLKYDSSKNAMLVASSLGSFTIDCSNKSISFLNHQRTTAITGNTERSWYGTLDNFYYYSANTAQSRTDLSNKLNSRITCLETDRKERVWVGTSANGVFILKNGNIVKHLTTDDGLTSDICRNLFIDNKDDVWVSTNMGISYITNNNGHLLVTKLNDNNCLPDNNVNDVLVEDDTVYVACNSGVAFFNQHNIISGNILPVYVTRLKFGNRDVVIDDPAPATELSNNTITIFFSALAYSGNQNLRYEYYIKEIGDRPITTRNGSVTYSGLAPGTYNFYVWGVDVFGNKSKQPAHISFTILPAWYQLWWVRTLAALLLIAIVAGITYLVSKRYERRRQLSNELRQTISRLELDAIKQQIDPHFIFNCLNAIQGVIYKSDTDTAAYFINRFARLMRKGLMLSKETFISIDEEYSFIDNYLEVEQLRLNKTFDYSITIDPAINKSQPIVPAFIVHPFVENAINHGIKYLKGQNGYINISVIKKDKIEIHITDNGIGINASRKLKEANASGHQSKGISLILSRVESLNEIYNRSINIQIADRSDQPGKERGTHIIISFDSTQIPS